MEYYYEGIEYLNYLDFKLFLHSVYNVDKHWHSDLELIFVVKGSIEVRYNKKERILSEGNIILINPNVVHSIKSLDDNLLLVIQMTKEMLYTKLNKYIEIDLEFINFVEMQTSAYKKISKILAEMAIIYVNKDDDNFLILKSLFYKLLHIMVKHRNFEKENEISEKGEKDFERLLEILEVANKHFTEEITLVEYAEMFSLTPQYFGNYFKKVFGVSFMQHIIDLRIAKAQALLIESDKTMAEISQECGFSSIKSFNTLFKRKVGNTPSEERNKGVELKNKKNTNSTNYFEVFTKAPYKELEKYLNDKTKDAELDSEVTRRIRIDTKKETKSLKHTWKNLITIGRASHVLDAEIQKMLIDTQKEINFKYIRFHGIFDDDMLIYNKINNDEVDFNFNQVEKLVDFLLSIGLKPFFELSFMPSELSSYKKTIFHCKSSTSLPSNIEHWNKLVRSFLEFLILKYGKEEVESWYFEFWNEPDMINVFGFPNKDDYFWFYTETYKTIKAVNEKLKIGGPAILSLSIKIKAMEDYIEFCRKNACLPDFFSYHVYPLQKDYKMWKVPAIDSSVFFSESTSININISSDVKYLDGEISEVNEFLKKHDLEDLPVFISEWNSTTWHRDLCSDTTYKSAYLVRNICNNLDKVDGLGLWMLSDYSHELFPSKNLFHGGLGLFTQNGLKKASYYAYNLLNKLGDELIESGKMHCVTKKGESYQILIFNYCQYDALYREYDLSMISQTERKNVFEGDKINIALIVDNIDSGMYRIKTTRISTNSGSVYDEWLKIGTPEILQKEEVAYLQSKSVPEFNIKQDAIEIKFEEFISLEKNEVILIELVKI